MRAWKSPSPKRRDRGDDARGLAADREFRQRKRAGEDQEPDHRQRRERPVEARAGRGEQVLRGHADQHTQAHLLELGQGAGRPDARHAAELDVLLHTGPAAR